MDKAITSTQPEAGLGKASSTGVPDSPGVLVFPPLLLGGTLLLGLLLALLWPWRIGFGMPIRIAGAVVVIAGGTIAQWGATTMRRAGTNVLPTKPALAIVTEGPFRFTRNPLYLANTVVFLGLAMVLNIMWLLVLFVPMTGILHWGIIKREERYLETKFGDAYLVYKARVRRWI